MLNSPSCLKQRGPEPTSSATVAEPAADQAPTQAPAEASALLTYCGECGSTDQKHDLSFAQCSRCSAHSFVTDPRQVMNWFDEVEERQAFE